MAERKLNLNAPLLSARRYPTPPKLRTSSEANGRKVENSQPNVQRSYPFDTDRSDVNSDQVTEPVAIPFHWEQIPGRAKDGSVPKLLVHKESSVTPRIPPGKVLDVVKSLKGKIFEDKSVLRPQVEASLLSNKVNPMDCSKERVAMKAGVDSHIDDDDVDLYSGALEALCATDSCSMNCSDGGLTGSEGAVMKPSGTFSTDSRTKDFMMRRFLPAAQAMTLETPQYTSRKQPVPVDRPKKITKVVYEDRSTSAPLKQCEPIKVPKNGLQMEENESSSDESVEYNKHANIPTKTSSWFPRLCFKNSLCLLNPIPGMKLRTQTSLSSACNVEKTNKVSYIRSQSQSMKQHSRDNTCEQKPDAGIQSPRVLEAENRLTSGSNRFTNASDRQASSARTSPFRRSGCISPYRNEAPKSPFRDVGFLGIPKEAENFNGDRLNLHRKGISKSQELFSPHAAKRGWSRPASTTFKKTVYVDTLKMAETPRLNKGSSDVKECVELARKEFKALSRSRELGKTVTTASYFQEAKGLNALDGRDKKEPEVKQEQEQEVFVSGNTNTPPMRGQTDTMKDLGLEIKALVCVSSSTDEKHDAHDQIPKDDAEKVETAIIPYPLPPTLPKTPSESWLWRTLPSIAYHSPFSLKRGTSFQGKLQDAKTASTNSKWETIVKSSYLHNDHVRYSEELISHVAQKFKS